MYGRGVQEPIPLSREAAQQWHRQVRADPLAWVIEAEGWSAELTWQHSVHERSSAVRARRWRVDAGLRTAALMAPEGERCPRGLSGRTGTADTLARTVATTFTTCCGPWRSLLPEPRLG
jgi:hypothetical protein